MPSHRRWKSWGLVQIALVLAGAGCHSPVEEGGSTVPGRCQSEAPAIEPQKTDLLFVIDNSGSMKEEQEGVALELPAFIEELQGGGGVSQDLQIGVVTTSVYQNGNWGGTAREYREYPTQAGRLQPAPLLASDGGLLPGTERILHGEDPELLSKLRLLVRQGTSGSGQETPFEAVRLALTEPLIATAVEEGGNQGFLRDGARLLVVVVSDEDDCSEMGRPAKVEVGPKTNLDYCTEQSANLTPVQQYHQVLSGLGDGSGARREVLWAAIGPVARGSRIAQSVVEGGYVRNVDCPTSFQPGYRQREMATLFDAELRNLDSICNANYRAALVAIASLANQGQTLQVSNIPDERLLRVELTRADGEVQRCTLANGGISYEPATEEHSAKIHFEPTCRRRSDDQWVELKLLCAS